MKPTTRLPLPALRATCLCGLLLSAGAAGATSLDFGASLSPQGGSLLRAGVGDLPLAGFTLGAGLSSRGLDFSVSRALVLTGLGAARARFDGAALWSGGLRGGLWSGGLRGGLNLSGTLGPLALALAGSAWNASVDRFDPLARWAEAAPDLRDAGAALALSGRYRLSRAWVLNAQGQLGGQPNLLAYGELRRGALSYRLGLRAGEGVLGAAAGLSYAAEDGLSLSADALFGPDSLGLSASLGLDGRLGEDSRLRAYAAYEPWRKAEVTAALRYGLEVRVKAGPGQLSLEGRGGSGGYGARVGYVLPLGGENADQP